MFVDLIWDVIFVFWVFLAIQTVVNLVVTGRLDRVESELPPNPPMVSIVVPARDEARGIEAAVTSFCGQDYPHFEVIVVDDQSQDATPSILNRLRSQFPNLRIVQTQGPPPGWLGKPHALETGRRCALGEWLLFVDADVVYKPDLLKRAMAHLLRSRRAMLTLIPNFGSGGWLESTMMSNLYFVSFAMLPVFLVSHSKWKCFAAGGGICNLVSREALKASRAFLSLKDAVVDDVGLGYMVKGEGYGLELLRAGGLVQLRMYQGPRETLDGFTKNLFPAIRNRPYLMLFPLVFGSLFVFFPYFAWVSGLLSGSVDLTVLMVIGLIHGVSLLLAMTFRQPLVTAFLMPLREFCWWVILFRSMLAYYRHGIQWRGRTFHL